MASILAPSTPRKMTAHGVELDDAPGKFGWLAESKATEDIGVLRSRIRKDGYLFLRNFWPRQRVQQVRDSLTGQLDRLGFLQPGTPRDEVRAVPGKAPGRATGNPLDQKDPLLRNLVFG